ncbi:hypothetical protein D3C87_1741540 [compost metagenome]
MGQFECQQPAQAMAEQSIGAVQFGGDFVGQLAGQLFQVTLQRLAHAHAAPRQLKRAKLQPGRQLAAPAAIDHGAGTGIRQAKQAQAVGMAHTRAQRPTLLIDAHFILRSLFIPGLGTGRHE